MKDAAIYELWKTGYKERQPALKCGHLDENRIIVYIGIVVADGQRSKQKYWKKYNAFSGEVRIIQYPRNLPFVI